MIDSPTDARVDASENSLSRIAHAVAGLSPRQQDVLAALLLVGVTAIDFLVVPQISFSVFYLLPVSMLAWHRGWYQARVAVLGATLLWLLADIISAPPETASIVALWNAAVSFGVFAIVGFTISRLRATMDASQRLARTDILTGLANGRWFGEFLAREVVRQRRYGHALSLAFLDCDDFKQVNDQLGHARGDELLCAIARSITSALREVDMVARVGGDEFAILLPETDVQAADTVARKVRTALQHESEEYHVTFSMGVVTYVTPALSTDALLKKADQAMYEAKRAGKNTIRHRVIGDPAAEGSNA